MDENVWGKSAIEAVPTIHYTRWRDRLHALVWPPKRRRLRMMRAVYGMNAIEAQRLANRIQMDLLLYGNAHIKADS
jgi:hypothetical protein